MSYTIASDTKTTWVTTLQLKQPVCFYSELSMCLVGAYTSMSMQKLPKLFLTSSERLEARATTITPVQMTFSIMQDTKIKSSALGLVGPDL